MHPTATLLRTNMQATFTYTPLKPCASIQKGRKRLHMSRQSRTADKNLQLHRSLEPVELISSCCKNNCFAKFDNLDNLKSLRSTFFNFGTQTLKKQFMKELLLAGIPDQLDYMDKQFRLGDIPVCYKYVRKPFGLSNTFLTSLKGTLTQALSRKFKTFSCWSCFSWNGLYQARARCHVAELSEVFL